jgi:hypothetical protein
MLKKASPGFPLEQEVAVRYYETMDFTQLTGMIHQCTAQGIHIGVESSDGKSQNMTFIPWGSVIDVRWNEPL